MQAELFIKLAIRPVPPDRPPQPTHPLAERDHSLLQAQASPRSARMMDPMPPTHPSPRRNDGVQWPCLQDHEVERPLQHICLGLFSIRRGQ
jgi:hypothetical protein